MPPSASETAGEQPAQQQPPHVPGLIYPPPEIRTIVDKTADYVARNDPQFEKRMREKEQQNPRFSFMTPSDPYHAYYLFRIKEARDGRASGATSQLEKPKVDELPAAATAAKHVPKEAPPYEFCAAMPPISKQDLAEQSLLTATTLPKLSDILKLTAQFVARNGDEFKDRIADHERDNHQFDFLKREHSLFAFFNIMVEQYRKVLNPPESLIQNLHQIIENKYKMLETISVRVEYEAYMAEQARKAQAAADEERIAFASIDWHDFVVVEKIEFVEEDERLVLPAPMLLSELEAMTLEQKRSLVEPAPSVEQQADNEDGVEMEMDDAMDMEDENSAADADEDDAAIPSSTAAQVTKIQDVAVPTNIRTDYVPKIGRGVQNLEPVEICPVCKASVKASEMAEHVRIELLDPKWKDQRSAYMAKQRDSNLVPIDPKILSRISGYRPDIFDGDNIDLGQRLEEDAEKLREAEKKKVFWDGHSTSIAGANQKMQLHSAENQMIAIQQRLDKDAAINAIGPQLPSIVGAPPPPFPPGVVPPPFMPGMPFPPPPPGMAFHPGMPPPPAPFGVPPPFVPAGMQHLPPPPAPPSSNAAFGQPPPFPFPGGFPPGLPLPFIPAPGMAPPPIPPAKTNSAAVAQPTPPPKSQDASGKSAVADTPASSADALQQSAETDSERSPKRTKVD
eukprot:jgi/Hompol1/323/HPOL_003961-RA